MCMSGQIKSVHVSCHCPSCQADRTGCCMHGQPASLDVTSTNSAKVPRGRSMDQAKSPRTPALPLLKRRALESGKAVQPINSFVQSILLGHTIRNSDFGFTSHGGCCCSSGL